MRSQLQKLLFAPPRREKTEVVRGQPRRGEVGLGEDSPKQRREQEQQAARPHLRARGPRVCSRGGS